MDANPIEYKDLVKPDSSIKDAIDSLTELKGTYNELAELIKKQATDLVGALSKVSSTTDSGRNSTRQAASDADRLARAYKELTFAQSENGAKLVELKLLTNKANEYSRQTAFSNSYEFWFIQ